MRRGCGSHWHAFLSCPLDKPGFDGQLAELRHSIYNVAEVQLARDRLLFEDMHLEDSEVIRGHRYPHHLQCADDDIALKCLPRLWIVGSF